MKCRFLQGKLEIIARQMSPVFDTKYDFVIFFAKNRHIPSKKRARLTDGASYSKIDPTIFMKKPRRKMNMNPRIALLRSFLDGSVSVYHAQAQVVEALEKAGYTRLREQDAWTGRAAFRPWVFFPKRRAAFSCSAALWRRPPRWKRRRAAKRTCRRAAGPARPPENVQQWRTAAAAMGRAQMPMRREGESNGHEACRCFLQHDFCG